MALDVESFIRISYRHSNNKVYVDKNYNIEKIMTWRV